MNLRLVLRWTSAWTLITLAGCIHVRIESTREVAAAVGAGEGVALFASPRQQGVSSESTFLDCLEQELAGSKVSGAAVPPLQTNLVQVPGSGLRLVPHQSFVDSVYPWLEPSTVLLDGDFATTLLSHQGISERVAKSGVRYLVAISGGTNITDKTGSISCAIGPGGGGCLGVAFWRKQSGYEANIWDLKRGISVGTVGTDVTGNSVFIGALVPLPLIAPVQRTACKRMATELQKFLNGGDP